MHRSLRSATTEMRLLPWYVVRSGSVSCSATTSQARSGHALTHDTPDSTARQTSPFPACRPSPAVQLGLPPASSSCLGMTTPRQRQRSRRTQRPRYAATLLINKGVNRAECASTAVDKPPTWQSSPAHSELSSLLGVDVPLFCIGSVRCSLLLSVENRSGAEPVPTFRSLTASLP